MLSNIYNLSAQYFQLHYPIDDLLTDTLSTGLHALLHLNLSRHPAWRQDLAIASNRVVMSPATRLHCPELANLGNLQNVE